MQKRKLRNRLVTSESFSLWVSFKNNSHRNSINNKKGESTSDLTVPHRNKVKNSIKIWF